LKHCIRARGIDELGEFRKPLIDMHSIHLYTASDDHYENVTAPLAAERHIEVSSALIDLTYYEHKIPATQPRPLICFDEWNVWMPSRAVGSQGAEEDYTLSDALAVGVWLNIFVRKSKDVGMANIAQSVNVLSPLMTSKSGIIKQTSWWPYELFCKYMKGSLIAVHLACEEYKGSTKRDYVRVTRRTPWLDVSATYDENEGMVNICVVNMHKEQAMDVKIGGIAEKVQAFEVTGDSVEVSNMHGEQKVGVKESEVEVKDCRYTFPKHSLTLLRWKA
jgi:alpha-L-arabinofuranosidase